MSPLDNLNSMRIEIIQDKPELIIGEGDDILRIWAI